MNRIILTFVLGCCVLHSTVDAQSRKKTTARSKTTGTNKAAILGCPEEGKGGDPNLNRRKNVRSDNQRATLRSVSWMKNLPDPKNFTRQGQARTELTRLGEGKKITVAAYALVARNEGAESCNCGLTGPQVTDNHIVLVDPTLNNPTLASNEPGSQTAEFTPRVRLDHSNLIGSKLQPLIRPRGRRLVRVTGLLLFDSEHFLRKHLKRANNWEVHPVLKLEYCDAATCQDTGTAGWKSLDNN